ncbi:MAG: HAMP domain-containing sensor histidine kinase [Sediminibacterium sp.]|nr:MAG: integral membrane sensor signal transduction histidine [Chitinophagaceae bacterium]MDP1843890.1 HAMP domain-containing sensor histidine kinase [Sediminibacterium sp.]TXT28716.1 MAG: integral membrane sensor signal transduction histidine kinase [Chitinophagaceae bacterium]
MSSFWNNLVKHPLNTLRYIGVREEMDFLEKKKTEVINIIMFLSIPLMIYLMILNFMDGRMGLFLLNCGVFSISAFIILLHKTNFLLVGRLIISFGFIFFYTLQAILYRNGTENFFYFNLILTLIFYSDKRMIYGMAILNCVIYIGIKIILNTDFYFAAVSNGRIVFNAAWSITASAIGLLFFKYQQVAYSNKIEQQNIELEKSNKTKEKLFSIIAHDLRSPIAQLKGTMDLVNNNYLPQDEFKKIALGLTKQIEEVQLSLDDLLIWSQNQLQGISNTPDYVCVKTAVETIKEQMAIQCNAKDIQLINLADEVNVWIDPDHFKLVLRNIISNAIKFSYPTNTVEIATISNGGKVTITITDHGIGMCENALSKLFTNSFFTTKGTAQEKGTGLGLELCKEFLELANATISVTSKPGEGAVFYITIPMFPSAVA